MRGLRVLVCGGRDFDCRPWLDHILDRVHRERGISLLIEGGQVTRRGDRLIGADWMAGAWAIRRGIPHWTCYAQWHAEDGSIDRQAGPARNARMLAVGRPDAVVAFPGGRGTSGMVRMAEAAGVPVWRPRLPAEQVWSVDAPRHPARFCAGVVIRDGKCVAAAPILARSVGRPAGDLDAYFRGMGWDVQFAGASSRQTG